MDRGRTIGGGLFGAGLREFMKQQAAQPGRPRPTANYAITADQREMARRGDVEGFWRARQAQGDPIAEHGLASLHPRAHDPADALFGGAQINGRLEAYSRVYRGRPVDIARVRRDLMQGHVSAVDADRRGQVGLLDPRQTAAYHHEVFRRHGLPTTAFGGTAHTGHPWEADATRLLWCRGCDR